jgi:hypothetical protein
MALSAIAPSGEEHRDRVDKSAPADRRFPWMEIAITSRLKRHASVKRHGETRGSKRRELNGMQTTHRTVSPQNAARMAMLFFHTPMLVYDEQAEPVGAIRYLLMNRSSGCVEYAVLRFNPDCVSGHGDYPMPWDLLSYHCGIDGYVVQLDTRILTDAPRCGDVWPKNEHEFCMRIRGFYGVAYTD